MLRYLLFSLLIISLAACGGGASKPTAIATPSSSAAEIGSTSANISTCSGETSLDKEQISIVRELAANTQGAVEVTCAGVAGKDPPFVKIHVVAKYKQGFGSAVREGEAYFQLQKKGDTWDRLYNYDLHLVDTSAQQQADQAIAQQTAEAFSANATAESRDFKALVQSSVEIQSASLQYYEEVEGGFPSFRVALEINNPTEGFAHAYVEAEIRLSDGAVEPYHDKWCCDTGYSESVDPGLQHMEYQMRSSRASPEPSNDETNAQAIALAQGAQLIRVRLIFSDGMVPGPWFQP